MELNEIKHIYDQIEKQLSSIIPLGKVVDVRLCIGTSYLGRCRKTEHGFIISINKNLNDLDLIKRTIAHELIHTCPQCISHGKMFKKYMHTVNQFGYNVTVVSEPCMDLAQKRESEYKYEIYCNCGFSTKRKKHMNVEKYRCPHCMGKLKMKLLS